MGHEIIPSESEFHQLLERLYALQAQLIELTTVRDDLKYHICPALEAAYNEKVGSLERELLAIKIMVAEHRYIAELLQAQLNRQEELNYRKAQQKASREFKEYRENLNRQAEEARRFNDMWEKETRWSQYDQRTSGAATVDKVRRTADANPDNDGNTSYSDTSDQQEKAAKEASGRNESPVDEIKSLYRQIVKRLHPDVNPDAGEKEKELLNQANEAYRRGDLEWMRRIWDEISGGEVHEEDYEDTPEGIAALKEKIRLFEERCQRLREEIAQIKQSFPYNQKLLLENEEALNRKVETLRQELKELRELDEQLCRHIDELRKQAKA